MQFALTYLDLLLTEMRIFCFYTRDTRTTLPSLPNRLACGLTGYKCPRVTRLRDTFVRGDDLEWIKF